MAAVSKARDYILAGDIFQVVLSRRWRKMPRCTAAEIYRMLRLTNPSPYMFLFDTGQARILGSSPEMLVRVSGDQVATCPIAGTRRRGLDREEDLRLEEELKADPKERAEHVMLVDLGRNDIGRVAEAGSVRVSREMEVERYSHVMHLVSEVEGRLRDRTRCVGRTLCLFSGRDTRAARPRCARWRSSTSSKRSGGGSTAALSVIATSTATSTRALRSAPWSSVVAVFRSRPAPGSSMTRCRKVELAECAAKAGALVEAVAMAEGRRQRMTKFGIRNSEFGIHPPCKDSRSSAKFRIPNSEFEFVVGVVGDLDDRQLRLLHLQPGAGAVGGWRRRDRGGPQRRRERR